jgi:redox-sensitive bicupin YhaK (pirin superfamily)
MISIRRSEDRGRARFSWLDSRHTFSFGHYYDPDHMGFGPLRVINEDTVRPGAGFETHGHRNMEIISYVLGGALEHRDSIGNGSVIRPGEVQLMSAGTGIRHSEFNHSGEDEVRFLQIWIEPGQRGLEPGYQQRAFEKEERRNALRLVVSPDGREGSLTIHQDASLYASLLEPGTPVRHALEEGRAAWIQVASGAVEANGERLEQGDGAAVSAVRELEILAVDAESEVLVFDLPAAAVARQ